MTSCPAFERTSKRRKGFPSETQVKRGLRFVNGGTKELVEKLGRNDPCPCGSGLRFQAVLPDQWPVSMGPSAMIIGGEQSLGNDGKSGRGGRCDMAVVNVHVD